MSTCSAGTPWVSMSKLVAPQPDDRTLWKRLLARVHPDAGGSDDLFTWATKVRESLCVCTQEEECRPSDRSSTRETYAPERIPYDSDLGYVDEHIMLTMRATSIGAREPEPFASILALLLDCPSQSHGRIALRQLKGATYKQLAYISHLSGLDNRERSIWYEICRVVPLSEQHAHHLIARLKERDSGC